jgi:c(7)-type cytochrome triheme protein
MRSLVCSVILVAATLTGCASAPPYGLHGDIVVGKKAVFRHKTSKMVKLDCSECHDKLYTTIKQHEKHTMPQIQAGESCGMCHNGKRAFSVTGNCAMCHRKS